jgi:hypothetical protein
MRIPKASKFWQGAIATIILSSSCAIAILSVVAHPSATTLKQQELDSDNIYHEDENLPQDADIFPRMGRIIGSTQDNSNCRLEPWGRVVMKLPGQAFVEIDNRQVDRHGESWFHVAGEACWLHDSRVDLL